MCGRSVSEPRASGLRSDPCYTQATAQAVRSPWMSKQISRRAVLRGAGVALSLPWLEAGAAEDRLTEPPLRMAFVFMPNGVRPELWTPPGDGEDYEITHHLKPLQPFKS